MTSSRRFDFLAKTRSRMMTAITFSPQNDASSRVSTTQYWENLVLVVLLVLESKALYQVGIVWFYWPFSRRSWDSAALHYGTVWAYYRASFFNGYYQGCTANWGCNSSLNFFGNWPLLNTNHRSYNSSERLKNRLPNTTGGLCSSFSHLDWQ